MALWARHRRRRVSTRQPKDGPKIRRNIEAIIQQLNDLGLIVDEWPAR
jgi:hypothetical protein